MICLLSPKVWFTHYVHSREKLKFLIGQNNFSFKNPRRMEERLDFQFLSVQQKHNYNLQ